MGSIQVATLVNIKISNNIVVLISDKYTKDIAFLSSDNSHKRRVVHVIDAFVDHIHHWPHPEHMPNEDKISSSVQAV